MTDWSVTDDEPAPKVDTHADFTSLMDKTFGKGKWQETGGYRSPAREDELRAEGAETVAPGQTSRHSLGTPDEPGARDIVVSGMTPSQVAKKLSSTGADFVHFIPEGAHGTQGAHLHVDFDVGKAPSKSAPDDPWKVVKTEPVKPGPVAKARAALPAEKPGLMSRALADIEATPGEALRGLEGGLKEASDYLHTPQSDRFKPGSPAMDPMGGFGAVVGDVIGGFAHGAVKPTVGNALSAATGRRISPDTGADVALLAAPFLGETKGGKAVASIADKAVNALARTAQKGQGVAENAARNALVSSDPQYAARVKRLQDEGIRVPPGSAKGGQAKRLEDDATTSIHVGKAVTDLRNQSIEDLNRAAYNRALKPIGQSYPADAPVGREGVGKVADTLSAAYQKILPQVRVQGDAKVAADMTALRADAKTLGPNGEAQYNAIVEQEILRHIREGGGKMDGFQFKTAESELSRLSRSLKGSADHNQRELGRLLDDTNDTLRDAAERSSPPGIRKQLKDVNSGYAVLTRIEDASARRLTTAEGSTPGVFSPTDLKAAVKKGDRSIRKRAFARGDALLQDLADDAEAVLPAKLGDSGTARRTQMNREGLMQHAYETGVGSVTNHIARSLLMRPPGPQPLVGTRNYLSSAMRRVLAPAGAVQGANQLLKLPPQQ